MLNNNKKQETLFFGTKCGNANSIAAGYATETTNYGEIATGILNKSTKGDNPNSPEGVVGDPKATLFSVGCGTKEERKNALEVKGDGSVIISGKDGSDVNIADLADKLDLPSVDLSEYVNKNELAATESAIQKQIATKANAQDVTNAIGELQDSIKNIAVTGGASTAAAVTFDNTASGMTAVNAQGAIEELNVKKLAKADIVQEPGNSEELVISQKGVTELVRGINEVLQPLTGATNEIDDEVTELYRTLGYTSRFREKEVKIFNGYLNYWGKEFISNSNYRTIFVNLKKGQRLSFTGAIGNSSYCASTTTDLSELSVDEIVSQWSSFEGRKTHMSASASNTTTKSYVSSEDDKRWFALGVHVSLVNEVFITGFKEISDNQAIREELIGEEITTIYTGKHTFTKAQNYFSFGILVSLGSADSVDISMNINQSAAYSNVLHCEKSGYYRITSPSYFIDSVGIVFNGTKNEESYVKFFEDKIGAALEERTRVFNNWDNYNAQTDVFLQDSLDYYRVVNRAYNSYKTLKNTDATLKKINKSSYTYAHVSMFKIKGDSVYLAHLQNTSSAGEGQTSTTYELVLQKFSLTRYASSDWDPDTDVTSLVLGKLGTSYTTASGDIIETVRTPGDHAIELVGDYLYIVHGVRPVVDDETIISYKYDTNSDSIVSGSTNICKLSYKGEEVDMTCSNFIKLLKADGYFSTGSATIHMSSQFVSYSGWYYNTLVTTDINTYGALVRTQDFINYELVSIIPFNKYGTDEIILGAKNNLIIVACRQKYGKTYMMMGYFNASTQKWIAWHKLPAGNTRPWIWTNNSTVYMMYPISASDRSRYQIVKNRTTNNQFIEWVNVCTIETNWDYPCMLVSNGIVYFSCSTNNRTQVKFGKLMLSNVDKMAKLIQLLDS